MKDAFCFLTDACLAICDKGDSESVLYPIFEQYRDQLYCVDQALLSEWLGLPSSQSISENLNELANILYRCGVKLHCYGNDTKSYPLLYVAISIYKKVVEVWNQNKGIITNVLIAHSNICIAYDTLALQSIEAQKNYINKIESLQLYGNASMQAGLLQQVALAQFSSAQVCKSLAQISDFRDWSLKAVGYYEEAILIQNKNKFEIDELNSITDLSLFLLELQGRGVKKVEMVERYCL